MVVARSLLSRPAVDGVAAPHVSASRRWPQASKLWLPAAFTGSNVAAMLTLALGLLAAGVLALVLSRRKGAHA